ncbi:DUF1285 domain-containing protein [Acetobacteraceae bacterium]|nr:DUF1285 domain-containing protein [Acetobacteraceae bacterium]
MTRQAVEESCMSKFAMMATLEKLSFGCQCLPKKGTEKTGRLPFRIARDGRWYYKSELIKEREAQKFLASMLMRDEAGNYFLQTPSGKGFIEVEDVPYIAMRMQFSGLCERRQSISLMTNIGKIYCVGPDHPLFCQFSKEEGRASVYLRLTEDEKKAPILARLSKAVIFELGALSAVHFLDGKECMGVWSRGQFFPIPCAF